MNEARHIRQTLHDLTMKSKITELIEAESRMVVIRG